MHFLPGIVAFRQHLQNLARTKGILELNKVQLLYEQTGPEADSGLAPAAAQLPDLARSCPQVSARALSTVPVRASAFVLEMCRFFERIYSRPGTNRFFWKTLCCCPAADR